MLLLSRAWQDMFKQSNLQRALQTQTAIAYLDDSLARQRSLADVYVEIVKVRARCPWLHARLSAPAS